MGSMEGNEEVKTPSPCQQMPEPPPFTPTRQPQFQFTPTREFVGNPWTTGLFDCHLDKTNALMTAFLPCVTFGQIAEVMNEGNMTCPWGTFIYLLLMPFACCQWILGTEYRTKLRNKYQLVEAPYPDVVSHVFCPFCSLCQEFRELRNRGLDPALGWNGIIAQQQSMQHANVQANAPPLSQIMFD